MSFSYSLFIGIGFWGPFLRIEIQKNSKHSHFFGRYYFTSSSAFLFFVEHLYSEKQRGPIRESQSRNDG